MLVNFGEEEQFIEADEPQEASPMLIHMDRLPDWLPSVVVPDAVVKTPLPDLVSTSEAPPLPATTPSRSSTTRFA